MIGRVLERKSLMRAVESNESQFVAVYGRRRIIFSVVSLHCSLNCWFVTR